MTKIIPNLSIIVAADSKNGIGIQNTLPWHLSDDLKRFKAITTGNTIIMGRNTWFSLPRRPLPNRRNVVLTPDPLNEEGAEEIRTLEAVFNAVDPNTENFIVGGESMYKQFLPHCTKVYLTRVEGEFATDTFFPDLDPKEWKLVEEGETMRDSKSDIPYRYLIYERIQ
ncbi:MAG: dihydrofolate reductase [Marinilabiliales bacterium]|nr:MAG: dihydrofolate reductase [Marinilabiliales bacterium]